MVLVRRALRRDSPDHCRLPIVFNDYMNCLGGSPSTEAELPLIRRAAELGCETYVVDAGWYGKEWFRATGSWRECRERFPGGLSEVFDAVRAAGMAPGLWLEPETVSPGSELERTLPANCIFHRNGGRVSFRNRLQLDFRRTAVRAALDDVVDRLIGDYGLAYLKFDYNQDASREDCILGAVNGILLRLMQSGSVCQLSDDALAAVREGIAVHRQVRADIPGGLPFWPLGLPREDDGWIALGLDCGASAYLAVWRLDGAGERIHLPLPRFSAMRPNIRRLYPAMAPGDAAWAAGGLDIHLPGEHDCARIWRLER